MGACTERDRSILPSPLKAVSNRFTLFAERDSHHVTSANFQLFTFNLPPYEYVSHTPPGAPKSAYAQPAGDTARRHLRRALLAQARMLLHRAAEHLRAHRDEFPEYDPENDIFNRCTTDGGFVQIR